MKKMRQLHLWIGLISSVFILIQSVTGLLVSEPWLIGQGNSSTKVQEQTPGKTLHQFHGGSIGEGKVLGDQQGNQSSLMSFIKNLHKGKIGNTNVKIFIDFTAVGMIFMTVTGIILSAKTLQSQNKRRRRKKRQEIIDLKMTAQ